jgi:hypothetical protein
MRNILVSSIAIFLLSSCYKDKFRERHPTNVSDCDTLSIMSYSANIKPIIDNACTANCHNGNGPGAELQTWNNLTSSYSLSRLISSITWDGGAKQMPQGAVNKIAQCDITKIKKWVAEGALNN